MERIKSTLTGMRSRLWVLAKHYSSYLLYAIITLGSLQEYSTSVSEYVPRWVLVVIAIAALISKTIPQTQRKD